jgi:hypothetical protein
MRSTKAPPGGSFGGGASNALRYLTPERARNCKAAGCGTKASSCEFSGEYKGTVATTALCRWAWQHEQSVHIEGESHSRAIPRQQSGCPVECATSRQAKAGIVVQRTTTASTSNALFLPQFIVF